MFNQPFGINALVGLIALSGILMRNTLILIGQIHHNQQAGPRSVPRGGGGDGAARPPGSADRAGGDPGVHSAHSFGLLGNARLYADWRDAGGNHH
ncbi:hypothetical protein LN650_13270 [Klebsiella pneumoniae subsp. pneumoniae]|nr:hypothetical protein [Klebsiella pneumoniae subsp. pneumoniae]